MKKFFCFVVLCALLLVGLKAFSHKPSAVYALVREGFTKPVQVEANSKVIFLLRNETIFIKNNKSHCIQKALFFNFSSGYVNCGHAMMDTVYHTFGNDNLPEDMHFTQRELRL